MPSSATSTILKTPIHLTTHEPNQARMLLHRDTDRVTEETATGGEVEAIKRSLRKEDPVLMRERIAILRRILWSVGAVGRVPAKLRSSLRIRSGQRTATNLLRSQSTPRPSLPRKQRARTDSTRLRMRTIKLLLPPFTNPKNKTLRSRSVPHPPTCICPGTPQPKGPMRMSTQTPTLPLANRLSTKTSPRQFPSLLKTRTRTESHSLSTTTS